MQKTTTPHSDWVVTGPGTKRRILAENPDMMMVEVVFQSKATGSAHSHPNVQSTYVQSGVFEFTVSGKTKTLRPGDALVIPSNAVHSCVALQGGVLLDAFTPRRDDFL